VAGLAAGLRPLAPQNIFAQEPRLPADGLYTAAQAERGKSVVETHCTECHGEYLSGGEGPALAGNAFMLKWEEQGLARLFQKIRETMPQDAAASVSDDDKIDAISYLLQRNGMPAGSTELTHDARLLETIQLRPAGSRPRNGATVSLVGCLAHGTGSEWLLTQASEPQTTKVDFPKAAAAAPLGTKTVALLSVFPSPAAHEGHKMEARGLLISSPNGDRINVLSLEMLDSSCGAAPR